jgi:hypothetical protein
MVSISFQNLMQRKKMIKKHVGDLLGISHTASEMPEGGMDCSRMCSVARSRHVPTTPKGGGGGGGQQ